MHIAVHSFLYMKEYAFSFLVVFLSHKQTMPNGGKATLLREISERAHKICLARNLKEKK